MDTILLQDTFGLYPSEDKSEVVLSSTQVRFFKTGQQKDKPEDAIALKDVIGCHVLHDKKKPAKVSYICIFSYPLKKKALGSGVVRRRVARTFAVGSKDTYQENLLVAERWKMTIKRLIAGEVIRTKRDIDNGSLKTRNLLVLVNPFSGRKKAMKMFKEKVQPMFAEAEIKYTVVTTEYPGHAKDFAQKLELHEWDGIVVVSGDGLVHEVINGLMNREDWREAIKIPLGVVPGGSGNALAASVVYASTGQILSSNLELDAVFEVVKGEQRKMSLIAAETGAGQKFYSFLNFAWGFIADVDIESERFRKLGPVRFAIGCAVRVANMRLYQGRISYLPATDKNLYSFGWNYPQENVHNGSGKPLKHRSMSVPSKLRSPSTFGSLGQRSLSTLEDNANDNILDSSPRPPASESVSDVQTNDECFVSVNGAPPIEGTGASGDAACLSSKSHHVNGDASQSKQVLYEAHNGHSKSDMGETDEKSIIVSTTDQSIGSASQCFEVEPKTTDEDGTPIAWKDSAICYHLRSPLDEDPPDDWVTIESEFIWVTSVSLSHLGHEMMGVPSARLDEDIMYIYTLRHGISKAKMVNVLLGFEAGTHIERGAEYSFVAPCKAVRLEPFTFITGHMTVDGELIPHCPIQASVTPHKIPIMSSTSD